MKTKEITKTMLKKALREKTKCTVQHTGWCCGTCFFAISDKLNNQDWQAVLLFRGDYAEEELNNLPQSVDRSLKKVYNLCQENLFVNIKK